ncbi:unnamed protein product [Haemonchus placei]|uniref:Cell cycle control protein 50A n=1 Tax=Haemonchus placei TaxID=6290 RepID=A0A0N4X5B5_HAEPC|nr:unnamed protein product [Haemonchus placei]
MHQKGSSLESVFSATKLRQQQLPAWQPILTASTVIPTVIGVGIIFIPIGVALFLASEGGSLLMFNLYFASYLGDVYLYYYLENYFQNHRRYVKSRNDKQYLGNVMDVSDCEPFAYDDKKVPIAPCGAIANSKFNDTYELYYYDNGMRIPVPVTKEGVLWDVDKDKKFKNPPIPPGGTLCDAFKVLWDVDKDKKFKNPPIPPGGTLCDAFKGTAKPPNWRIEPCLDDGFENVDLIVWMRTAALPNFRKLWRLLDRTSENLLAGQRFRDGLPAGQYEVTVHSTPLIISESTRMKPNLLKWLLSLDYPVVVFGGRKSFVVSTTSWAGAKNPFLGIAYIVVGSLSIVLGIIFIGIHVKFGHS